MAKCVFRIIYIEDDEIIEIYAKHVTESDMFGFIVVEDIIFGEKSSLVVDPSEERLKVEFSEVERTYIPLSSIVRIDEMERQGVAKVSKAGGRSKVGHLPSSSLYSPPKKDD